MKKCLAFILLLVVNYSFCQIVNGDFENWRALTTSPISEDPIGWSSNNPGIIHHYGKKAVERSTDFYTGDLAVRINQFYDSTSTCKNNFLVYKELFIDTAMYSNKCYAHGIDISSDYDTLSYFPHKISFYYKTVNLKASPFNWFEINVIDTTDPFGISSGSGLLTIQLTPSSTYIRKEIVLNSIIGTDFQLIRFHINISNSFDSLYKDGYVLIDNIQFEGISSIDEIESNNNISIYPNPSNNIVSIDKGNLKIITSIKMLNINGKIIENYSSNTKKIDVSNCKKGIYFLVFESEKGPIYKKLIIN